MSLDTRDCIATHKHAIVMSIGDFQPRRIAFTIPLMDTWTSYPPPARDISFPWGPSETSKSDLPESAQLRLPCGIHRGIIFI